MRLNACSTNEIDGFYSPQKAFKSDVEYLREYRPIYCITESVLKPQDTSLRGDGGHRHDDYRKLQWRVDKCQGNSQVTCSTDSAADLEFLKKIFDQTK